MLLICKPLRAGSLPIVLGLAAIMFLQVGAAEAETVTFSSDSLFTTDVLDGFYRSMQTLALDVPVNSATPELQTLAAEAKVFDATVVDMRANETLTDQLTGVVITDFSVSTGTASPEAHLEMEFQSRTETIQPVPLPAAVWLMLSGLGGLVLMARKRPFPPMCPRPLTI